MKVSELKSAMQYIVETARTVNLESKFDQFNKVVQQILRQNQRVEVGAHKEALFQALRAFDYLSLPYGQREILVKFEADKYVGNAAIEQIDRILHDEKFDPVGVAQKISEQFEATRQFISRASTFVEGLRNFSPENEVKVAP